MQTIPIPKHNIYETLLVDNETLLIVRREFRYNYETKDYDIYYILKKSINDVCDYKTITESSIFRKKNFESHTINNLKSLCKKYVLRLRFYKNDAYVSVFGEEWCIQFKSSNKIILWHKNEKGNIHDYHIQKEFIKTDYSLEYVINYMLNHGIDKNS